METTSNKKNDAKTLTAEDWEKLCDSERRALLRTRFGCGVAAKTKEPAEYVDWILYRIHRDERLPRRLPYLIAEAEGAAQLKLFERMHSLIVSKRYLDWTHLAIAIGDGAVSLALYVGNSALDDSVELENNVLREIRAGFWKTFAFPDGEPRDVAEEVVALGLGRYPPDAYATIPNRLSGTVSMNPIAATAMLLNARTLDERES
ncbi:MAG: hypothetical protein IKU86_06270 [Thermoguttaceae bacterium]|nr:hypothetical protein [Thermoguttaceae bacterium]